MKKFTAILFFICIYASYGQTKLLDSLKPESTLIKNTTQFSKARNYFEEAIKDKRSVYDFSENHLQLAESCLQWSELNETEEAVIRTKYYLFHYYYNQFKANPETIYRARELLKL